MAQLQSLQVVNNMPVPSGEIYLCANAIVSYQHTIDFKTPEEQQTYWGSLVKYTIPKTSYVRKQRTFVSVDYPLDRVKDINYLFYRAAENAKLYYCYVTGKEYISDNVTYIYFEIDVMQTYLFDYKVHPSYIVQEHVDRWDANHKPIYSRTDEGLDYGQEYVVESAYKVQGEPHVRWFLALMTNPRELVGAGENANASTLNSVNNPYTMYLIPGKDTAANISVTTKNSAGEVTTSALSDISIFTALMSNSAMGKYVHQIIKLPYLPFNFKYQELDSGVFNIDTTAETGATFGVTEISSDNTEILPSGHVSFYLKISHINPTYDYTRKLAEMGVFEGIESAMPTAEQWAEVTANPYTTERDKRFESKLLTHPYRYNLLSDWRGQPQVIKNEYLAGEKIKLNYTQGFTFNSPARYWIEGHKKDPEGRNTSIVQLVPEEAPVINDAYYSYLLANKNQVVANMTSAMVSQANNLVQGMVGSALTGNFIGAGVSGIGGMFDMAVNTANMLRNENAKRQDIKNLPDTIINSNDCAFNIMDDNEYVTLYRYKICCEFEEQLADTFATSGYTIRRLQVPNTKSRVRYNYVKTIGANITGSFDQNDLAIIKAIYDNGITFWHYNTINFKPLDYSLENIETKLIKG